MIYAFLHESDFDIPESMSFKIAFVIVTMIYVISMIVLLRLYKNAVKKIPKASKDDTTLSGTDNISSVDLDEK
ncbi:MAG: hypothetical protein K2H01_04615 [Ruminococcus sp.]|nr:hypothetical protein [Ruminococcus sp.]